MHRHEGGTFLIVGTFYGHGDGGVVVFKSGETVAPEFPGESRSVFRWCGARGEVQVPGPIVSIVDVERKVHVYPSNLRRKNCCSRP